MTKKTIVSEDATPLLPRGVRLRDDAARGEKLLLAPERVLKLDEIAWAIASRIDGARTVAMIADELAVLYRADRVRVGSDACGFLQQLADRGFVELADGGS